jgi:hypothetical protein
MNGTGSVRARLALILCALVATACANQTTSYRTERFGPNGPAVISVDAYQRHTVMVPESEAGRANQWRVCSAINLLRESIFRT